MKDFRQLRVWEKAHEVTLEIYQVSQHFPKEELYGLTNQIRRAAVSIPANIAEGCGKDSPAEFLRYLRIAMGSASELEYELQLAHDLKYLPEDAYQTINVKLITMRRMLNALIMKMKEPSVVS